MILVNKIEAWKTVVDDIKQLQTNKIILPLNLFDIIQYLNVTQTYYTTLTCTQREFYMFNIFLDENGNFLTVNKFNKTFKTKIILLNYLSLVKTTLYKS